MLAVDVVAKDAVERQLRQAAPRVLAEKSLDVGEELLVLRDVAQSTPDENSRMSEASASISLSR